jgi:hypothetical protein
MQPICQNVEVQLTGEDGNALFIIGRVTKAMKLAQVEKETIEAFTKEAMSGDYDDVLQTCMKYVEVA